MIQFNQVCRIFPDGTCGVDSVNLHIRKGEFCVLLGPSGAGKSTLMGMSNGMVIPDHGYVCFDGEKVTKRNMRKIQARVGMVHQQLLLVPRMNVLSNVTSGKLAHISNWRAMLNCFNGADRQRACQLLSDVALEEQHLYRRASALSGGQQQRVAIARAFMPNPEVVLADEPVASLDPAVSRNILSKLKETSRNHKATVLCSLHQVEFALEFADRIIGLRKGKVVFDDRPEQLDAATLELLYQGNQVRPTPPALQVEQPNPTLMALR